MTHRSTRRQYGIPARALLALALVGAGAARAEAAPAPPAVDHVRSIDVTDHADLTAIRVRGDQAPTFTVFKLSSPPRLVVDLAGADVSAIGRLTTVDKGDVHAVVTTQFSDANAKVGRVMVALDKEATYDVKADGNDVVITVDHVGGSAPVADATAPAADPAPVTAASAAAPKADPAPKAPVAAATPKAPAAPVAAEKPAPRPQPSNLPPGVVARHVYHFHGHRGHRVLAVGARSHGRFTAVDIRTDGAPRRVVTLELVSPPRLAVDLEGMTGAPHRARLGHLGRRAPVADVRIGEHAHKVRVVIDGRGTRMASYAVHRTAHGLAITFDGRAAPAAVASAAPATDAHGLAYVRALTYGRAHDVGHAVLALEGGHGVHWKVNYPDAHTAVLTLDGAKLDPQLEQTFDASRFGGSVRALTAFSDPGHAGRVKVVANLARHVPSRVTAESGELTWTFPLGTRPAGSLGGPATERVATVQAAGLSTEGAIHVASSGERARYHGRRINLDFKDIDVQNVLRLIAEVSKRNLVVSGDVKGKITLRLRNVPWDQALDLILKSNDLGKEVMGNIIRIAPEKVLEKEQQAAVKAREAKHKLENLAVRLIPVNFADASDMASKVKDVLSDRGSVTVDTRTNVLIVKDVVSALARAEQLVRRLDTETPQVLIESRIVEANTNYTREVGIQWGGNVDMTPATGNPTGLVFPNTLRIAGAATDGQTPTTATSTTPNFAVNMPAAIGTNSGGGIGLILGSVNGVAGLNLRLSALENQGRIKTISAPRVATLDNEKASISQGLSIPFSQVSAAGVNTTFIEAKLELDVTPHVTENGSILMNISVTNNQPNPQLTGANGQPSISKKEAKTNVMVKDGQTTVIGGIYTRSSSVSENAVPGLSKIPILGWLFKKRNYDESRTELLVFITPRILNRLQSAMAGQGGG